MEKEKVKVFGEGEHLFLWKRRKRRGKRRKIFGKVISKKKNAEGKYLEKENISFVEEKKKEDGKKNIFFVSPNIS